MSWEFRLGLAYGMYAPEVRRQALIKDGRNLIPAASMARTKGDAAAVLSVRLSPSELEGTKRPIIVTPRM